MYRMCHKLWLWWGWGLARAGAAKVTRSLCADKSLCRGAQEPGLPARQPPGRVGAPVAMRTSHLPPDRMVEMVLQRGARLSLSLSPPRATRAEVGVSRGLDCVLRAKGEWRRGRLRARRWRRRWRDDRPPRILAGAAESAAATEWLRAVLAPTAGVKVAERAPVLAAPVRGLAIVGVVSAAFERPAV